MDGLKTGDVVKILSSGQIGAVLRILHNKEALSYEVLVNGEKLIVDFSQLKIEDSRMEFFDDREEFDSLLSALAISNPGNDLYSLNTAKIDFIPYQYRPVLKMIKSDEPRILIADDVGVGKTIEAGLIVKELSARQSMNNVLIFCPRPLVAEKKWQNEMRNKFNEKFLQLDRKMLQNAIKECDYEGEWAGEYSRCIIPYSILDEELLIGGEELKRNRAMGLFDLNPPPKFDLIIVDEAHHIRNPNTQAYKVIRYFCDHSEAVVFLTATPIQLGDKDLFVLLNLLRPDYIIDEETFSIMSAPNPHINLAINCARDNEASWGEKTIAHLQEALKEEWSKKTGLGVEIEDVISKIRINMDSLESRVSVISEIEHLHTFSNIINRTRKRDIGDFTVRKPVTIRVRFSDSQKKLYDALIDVQTKILTRHYKESMIRFLMSTLYRQASSCIFGLAPHIEEILSRHYSDEEWEEENVLEFPSDIKKEMDDVLILASQIDDTDEKYNAFKRIIDEKSKLDNKKVMVFSAFRHTLSYLYTKLKSEGFRVGLVTGDVKDEERQQLREYFMLPPQDEMSLDVLLFSEVGCEGLDYQFCDCLVNYDLPWNPMRIEQRIGRIDRNGQKSESILIYNLITEETIDADIYDRCLFRIGIFNQSLGCGEEILGDITKEIQNIAVNFSLSLEEKNDKLRQLADNKIRLINENQIMEENQYDFLSVRLPYDEDKKSIQEFSNHWLEPGMLRNLVAYYLHEKYEKRCIQKKDYYEVVLDKDIKRVMLGEYYDIKTEIPYLDKNWISFLKNDLNSFKFALNQNVSNRPDDICQLNALHPLVIMSSRFLIKQQRKTGIFLECSAPELTGQEVGFAIYEWRYLGDRNRSQLKIITDRPEFEDLIFDMVRNGTVTQRNLVGKQDDFSEIHRKIWMEEREKYRLKQIDIYSRRQASLRVGFENRLDLIRKQIESNNSPNIIRMKNKEYENVSVDYRFRIQQLEDQKEKVDIISKFICSGLIMVI